MRLLLLVICSGQHKGVVDGADVFSEVCLPLPFGFDAFTLRPKCSPVLGL